MAIFNSYVKLPEGNWGFEMFDPFDWRGSHFRTNFNGLLGVHPSWEVGSNKHIIPQLPVGSI